jgi:hypothetical protein
MPDRGRDHGTWHRLKGRVKRLLGWLTADRRVEAAGRAEAGAGRPVREPEITEAEHQLKARYGERRQSN